MNGSLKAKLGLPDTVEETACVSRETGGWETSVRQHQWARSTDRQVARPIHCKAAGALLMCGFYFLNTMRLLMTGSVVE